MVDKSHPSASRVKRLTLVVALALVVIGLIGGGLVLGPGRLWERAAPGLPSPADHDPTTSPALTTRPTTPTQSRSPSTPPATPAPAQKPAPPEGDFELPLVGSVGFAAVKTSLKAVAGLPGGTLRPGQSFTIEKDEGRTWLVRSGKAAGRLTASEVMIDLPDVIPSIVYRDVNGGSAVFTSSGVDLPGVTGKRLYTSRRFNAKLQAEEYSMPVLYPMARKIHAMQQAALADDETLILYQAFRPHAAQRKVSLALIDLHRTNRKVRSGIEGGGWGISSFIALNLSSHQLGTAIDVTLGEVTGTRSVDGRDYRYTEVEATEYQMQTPMHELSRSSSTYAHPVRTRTGTAWKRAQLNPKMTKPARRLQNHAVHSGLTPLASEWWHFDDWDARRLSNAASNGRYRLDLPE